MTTTKQMPSLDLARTTFGVLFLIALVLSNLWLLSPFLPSLIWASTIVVTLWPLVAPLQRRLWNSRKLATLTLTLSLLLMLIVPLVIAILAISENVGDIASKAPGTISEFVKAPPAWISDVPYIGPRVASRWRQAAGGNQEELVAKISPYIGQSIYWLLGQLGGLGLFLLHLTLTLILSAILFMNGERAAGSVRKFAHRLAGERGEPAAVLAANSIRAVAMGVIGTAFIQAALAGIGLVLVGVPNALMLSSLALFLGIIQVGSGPVMIGSLIWIYYWGSTAALIGFGIWTAIVLTLDNFLRPVLIRRGVDLPLLLIFAGVIGGILAFGIVGLFIGPVILAVSHTLLSAWMNDK